MVRLVFVFCLEGVVYFGLVRLIIVINWCVFFFFIVGSIFSGEGGENVSVIY